MPDTLKLYRDDSDTSGLDLSSYVDLTEGGINPGDEATRQPVYSQGSLGYGEQLVHVQTKARPFTAALLLFGSSVDALGALQQTIEGYLVGARPVIEWARQGATSSTWFRVRYGRVLGDARYDQKRESQTRYGKRLLVLTVEPFGTGSRVLASTAVGSAPVTAGPTGAGWASFANTTNAVAAVAPSNPAIGALPSIGGDAPVRWRIGISATAASPMGDAFLATGIFPGKVVAGISATPYSVVGFNAASSVTGSSNRMKHSSGTAMGPTSYFTDPWSPGGGFALQFTGSLIGSGQQIPLGQSLVLGGFFPSAPPPGLYRLFAAVRVQQHTSAGSSVPALAQMTNGGVRGPIATLALRSPSQWAWYDMGDAIDINGSLRINFGYPAGFTGIASPIFLLGAFAAIPKHTRYWEIESSYGLDPAYQLAVSADSDDGLTPVGAMLNGRQSGLSRSENLTSRTGFRGDIPVTAPLGSGATGAWYLAALAFRKSQGAVTATAPHHANEKLIVACSAWDSYTFAK